MAVYHGGFGTDILEGSDGFLGWFPQDDTFYGYDGNDTIRGNGGKDTVYGGNGNDHIDGGGDKDLIYGEDGNDFITGGDDNDTIYGGAGNDTIYGGGDGLFGWFPGHDYIDGGAGNDAINGEGGNDTLDGGSGDDAIHGSDGNDTIYGWTGNDRLFGGNDSDRLFGESGNDYLHGGSGHDTLTGGFGEDTFALRPNEGIDVITDWDPEYGTGTDSTSYDWIEVTGNTSQYHLGFGNYGVGSTASDTGIYFGNSLIGIVQDSTNVIISRDFLFV